MRSQKEIVKSVFDKRVMARQENELKAADYERMIYASDNEYAELINKYKNICLQGVKYLSNNTDGGKFLYSQADAIKTKITEHCKKNHYNLEPRYQCKICKDTLFVSGYECSCIKKQVKEAVLAECGVFVNGCHTFNDVNFDKVPAGQQRSDLENLYKRLSSYVSSYKTHTIGYKPNNVLLAGSAGIGKTFLLECIYADAIDKSVPAIFIKAFELNQYFLQISLASIEDKKAMWDLILNEDILIIDDLGTEPIYKKVTIEFLYNLIDYRYSYNKPFLISTNFTLQGLFERYGDRIASRILDKEKTLAFDMKGQDMRLRLGR